jgi:dolichol-phosphate mannosyltransferase
MLSDLKKQFFSIVIPSYNEGKNIISLYEEIKLSLKDYSYEIIFINDASTDNSNFFFESIRGDKIVRILNQPSNSGQSACLYFGIKNANHKIIVTMDGDCQNDPKDIINLLSNYQKNLHNNIHLVGGIRNKRKDNFIKIFSSKIANVVRSSILKDNCPDTGCGLKVFTRDFFLKLPYFNGMHRFLPALFLGLNSKTLFINVNHRQRLKGKSKYGTINRLFFGIMDIFKVIKIIKNLKKTI